MIPLFKVHMRPGVEIPAGEVLNSGYVGQGKKVDEFEELLKDKFQNDFAVTVNSATSGLHLLYHMLGDDQDEVLTTALTCTASNWPIVLNRKRLKWVDVDESCNIDLTDLERKLSPKTKIINVVHWGGNPVDLDEIERIRIKCLDTYGFKPAIIQDCAHAIGSTFKRKSLAGYYNSIYSFQAIKHFTTVDGGCVFVENEEMYRRAKLLRWYGINRDDNRKDFRCEADIKEAGFKFHMNDLNAVIGIHNFNDIDLVVNACADNSLYYDEQLIDCHGITIIKKSPKVFSSQWIHTLHVERREDFVNYMTQNGITVSRVHERNDKHTCMKEFLTPLPGLDKVVDSMICIPNGWWVTTEDRERIVDLIKKGW